MKSPMVENAGYLPADKKARYSELQVLRSNAGWYVGTTYTDEDDGFVGPGSRDSGYYATREEAERALALICQGRLATRRYP